MPLLSQHPSNEFTKMLLIGDSGSGKTGAGASLVADYSLRILDMDNGLETLKQYVRRNNPDRLDQVEYRTLRDKYKASPIGPVVDGSPRAFVDAYKMLDRWKYDDVDLGKPSEWGPGHILVIDSLTFLSDAGYEWAKSINPGAKDPRQWYFAAQEVIEKVIDTITGAAFKTNVIVISHVRYVDNPDGSRKGYPTCIGSALSPVIPRYFNSFALCQTKAGGKRTIQTAATAMIDLKNPRPFDMQKELPIETGLADFFATLRKYEPPKVVVAHIPELEPTTKPTRTFKR